MPLSEDLSLWVQEAKLDGRGGKGWEACGIILASRMNDFDGLGPPGRSRCIKYHATFARHSKQRECLSHLFLPSRDVKAAKSCNAQSFLLFLELELSMPHAKGKETETNWGETERPKDVKKDE